MKLEILKNTAVPLRELAEEKLALDQREARANAEIESAAADGKVDSDKVQQKITRASATITVCRSRRERLEAGMAPLLQELREIYNGAKAQWNRACIVRRELVRVQFLDANKAFWGNDEGRTADALAGILPPQIYNIGRGGWDGFWPPPQTPEGLVKEIECFVSHIERKSEELGIPIE